LHAVLRAAKKRIKRADVLDRKTRRPPVPDVAIATNYVARPSEFV
jgi:hypothetical protein